MKTKLPKMPEGLVVGSPGRDVWGAIVADWYASVWDEWGSEPWISPEPSVPSVRRRRPEAD